MLLQLHSKGQEVVTLQKRLIDNLPREETSEFEVTGSFDKTTQFLVKRYQMLKQLAETGEVDDIVMGLLNFEPQAVIADPFPPVVVQDVTQYECWNAALRSYLPAIKHKGKEAKYDRESWLKAMKGFLGHKNGLKGTGWDNIAIRCHLNRVGFNNLRKDKRSTYDIRADDLYALIQKFGYAILAYNLGNGISHDVVLFGVRLNPGASEHEVAMMDPFGLGITGQPFSWIRRRPGLYFVFSKKSEGSAQKPGNKPFPAVR